MISQEFSSESKGQNILGRYICDFLSSLTLSLFICSRTRTHTHCIMVCFLGNMSTNDTDKYRYPKSILWIRDFMSFHLFFSFAVAGGWQTMEIRKHWERERERKKGRKSAHTHTIITLNELKINDSHRFRCYLQFALLYVCVWECFYLVCLCAKYVCYSQCVKSGNLALDFNFTANVAAKKESMGDNLLLLLFVLPHFVLTPSPPLPSSVSSSFILHPHRWSCLCLSISLSLSPCV